MAGAVNPSRLSVQVRFERRGDAGNPAFLLDVSLEAPPGITVLFGPSGAGKSTLLDIVAGVLRPNSGRIAVGDDVLLDTERHIHLPPQRRKIAYVFQSLALFPHMTVEQNVAFGLAYLNRNDRQQRIETILRAFRIEHLHSQLPSQISGGEKQRVALARSVVTQPRLLLLDEPLTGLDADLKTSLINDLRTWNALHKIPILYVTHNRGEVDALGERVIAMDQGRILTAGTPREVLDHPRQHILAQAAGFENIFKGIVLDLQKEDGVMAVRLADGVTKLEVPLSYASPGDLIRVAIRAGDILLAAERPSGLSARNVLQGKIASLEQRGAIISAQINCNETVFAVHVTPGAVRELQLATGKQVWLVVKTHSCHEIA